MFSLGSTTIVTTVMKFLILFLVTLCFTSESLGKKGFGPGEQEWGYVQVRPAANMFWWLYYTTANVKSYYEKPLVIWLQGGPGSSSTAYGNFEEFGPLDTDLKPRNYTWVKDYNVLFIDNPVGSGFSYVTSVSGYAKTNAQIASDLVECMKAFLKQLPQFADVPTYITTESYGGKMGAEFALTWFKAQKAGSIKSNLKGVALGDAWISPIDSVMTWAPYLQATSMIDKDGYKKIEDAALTTKKAVETGRWKTATALWSHTQSEIFQATGNIDFYNILTKVGTTSEKYPLLYRLISNADSIFNGSIFSSTSLEELMNGPVKKALNLPVNNGRESDSVFLELQEDFMKPVIDKVEQLLNQTDLKVVVLTGQLDLIVDTPGTVNWVEKLRWRNISNWQKAARVPILVNNIIEGYVKSYGNFAFYWVDRAGHMVPKDNPNAMAQILKDFAN